MEPPSWSHILPRLYELFLASRQTDPRNWFFRSINKRCDREERKGSLSLRAACIARNTWCSFALKAVRSGTFGNISIRHVRQRRSIRRFLDLEPWCSRRPRPTEKSPLRGPARRNGPWIREHVGTRPATERVCVWRLQKNRRFIMNGIIRTHTDQIQSGISTADTGRS